MKAFWILVAVGSVCLAFTAGDDAKLLPEGSGRDAVAKVCLECHGASNFRKIRLDRDEWWEQVDEMLDRGAKGTDEELTAVVGYLERNFGTGSKVWVNTAPLAELKAVLGFTVDESKAVIAYRQENGNFRDWRDLLKVPSVDAKKIQEKKDRMAF